MIKTKYPPSSRWPALQARPTMRFDEIKHNVLSILSAVQQNGDEALSQYTSEFDHVELNDLCVTKAELDGAAQHVPRALQSAIAKASTNIRAFHAAQHEPVKPIETSPGVICWRKSVPIEKVGFYVPGGTAPLFSTVLMLAIPARIAGCKEIVICTPPGDSGSIHPAILYCARELGVGRIYKVGGAQAIAAMAYGTDTIPRVDKIFGPGNQYVTAAKQIVSSEGVAIDMPAGPTELAVIADASCKPHFIAADLLSQAEHGIDSQVVLLSDHESVIDAIQEQIEKQIANLPRRSIARQAMANSRAILLGSIDEALDFANAYAPEHLILALNNAEIWAEKVKNAGSVFLGHFAPESVGDYASGTNHTLPTNGFARAYSGVSLDSFYKKITFQQLTEAGLQEIGPAVEAMAEAEDLHAHKHAVSIRLNESSSGE